MSRFIGSTFVAIVVCSTLLSSAAFAQRAARWDMWIAWPHTNYVTQAMIEFADLVEERSAGRLQIQVHPGGALGFQGPEVLGAVRSGAVPIAEVFTPNMQGLEPLFELPMLPIPSGYEESQVLYGIAEPYYQEALSRHNALLLAPMSFGTVGLYTKNPIEETSDLAALVVRTASPGGTALAEAAGMRAMTIPWGEVHSALSTGLVNSVMTSSLSGVDGAFWEVTNYFYNELFPLSIERDLLIVNQAAFQALPEDVQQIVRDTANEIAEQVRVESQEQERQALATLEANGVTVIELAEAPDWLVEAVADGSEQVVDTWVHQAGADAAAIVEEFRAR